MINYNLEFTNKTWVNIVPDGTPYFLQIKKGSFLISASVSIPTSTAGAFEVEAGCFLHSALLSGNIWIASTDGTGLITYAK